MKREKIVIVRVFFGILVLMTIFSLSGVWVQANTTSIGVIKPQQIIGEKAKSPLQQALNRAVIERNRKGLPIPGSVTYDYNVSIKPQQQSIANSQKEDIIINAVTILQFDHPKQAGLRRWPDLIISNNLPQTAVGFVKSGDYTNEVQAFLAQQLPGIWDKYEFGYEPRRYIFKETYKITYPDQSAPSNPGLPITVTDSSTVQKLVFGFTETGPRIDYIFEEAWEVCLPILGCETVAEVKAGLELDWDIGLRLPIEVNLVTPDTMTIGQTYNLTSTATPLDWSNTQYQQVGLEAANGNEFLLNYVIFLGVRAEIIGKDVVQWGIDAEYDASASFTTPFGPNTSFPLPPLALSPDETGLQWEIVPSLLAVGLGLIINPNLNHSEIAAAWEAVPDSDASGSGSLMYIDPQTPTTFGPVTADDFSPATNQARIRLKAFQYGFDTFSIELGGYLEFELFGFGIETGSFDIANFSLDDISDGPWLDIHDGTRDTIEHMAEVRPNFSPSIFIYLPIIKK